MPRAPAPQMLTVEEAAQAIHASVSPNTVRQAIREGRLAAVKIGK